MQDGHDLASAHPQVLEIIGYSREHLGNRILCSLLDYVNGWYRVR